MREDRRELGLGRTCSGAVWMGGKREGGDKRRLLSLQAFGPIKTALKITRGEGGVISDFLVSHPGAIFKTMNRIAQAPFRGDSCKHLVQPFWSGVYGVHIRPGLFHALSSTAHIITFI